MIAIQIILILIRLALLIQDLWFRTFIINTLLVVLIFVLLSYLLILGGILYNYI